jgi:membrane protease YdiL (CAAX protease family)
MSAPPSATGAASVSRRGLGLIRALSWCVVAYAGLQLGLTGVASFGPQWGSNLWLLGAVEVVVIGGLALLLFVAEPWAFKERQPDPQVLPRARALGLGFALGLSMKAPADGLRSLIDVYWPTPEAELQAQAELLRHDTWSQILCLIVVIGLLGPIVEEAFYRGATFSAFTRAIGRGGAVLLSSAVFAVSHASPRDWLPLGLVAAGLGAARSSTSSLWASIGAHVAFNLAALGLLVLGHEIDVARSAFWAATSVVSVAATAFLLRALGPRSAST